MLTISVHKLLLAAIRSNVKPILGKSLKYGCSSYNNMPALFGMQCNMCTESHPNDMLKKDAQYIFDAAVSSVLPHNMVKNTLKVQGNTLHVADMEYTLNRGVHIVAFGKAVLGMVRAAEDVLGDRIVGGIASVPTGMPSILQKLNKGDLLPLPSSRVQIMQGSANNIPDDNALQAALKIEQLLQKLNEDDFVLTLITGGGSALLPYPVPPITLEEMALVTKLLSRGGATIQQMNTVRKHIEKLKGGGIAKVAYPAKMATLILSDVIGDDIDIIASGPTVPDVVSPSLSLHLIQQLGLEDQMPLSVLNVLQSQNATFQEAQQDGQFPHDHIKNILIGTNVIALNMAQRRAEQLGYIPLILTSTLSGNIKDVSVMFTKLMQFILALMYGLRPADGSDQARANTQMELELVSIGIKKYKINEIRSVIQTSRNSNAPLCILAGGETTVEVRGQGLGGRNQEMALLLAMEMKQLVDLEKVDCSPVFLSAGTDGQDGPTHAAGALVDTYTITTAHKYGLHPRKFLRENDSYNFFKELEDGSYHIVTGLTGTNVMDIQILLLKPNSLHD